MEEKDPIIIRFRFKRDDIFELNRTAPQVQAAKWIMMSAGMILCVISLYFMMNDGDDAPDMRVGVFWGIVVILVGFAAPYLSGIGGWNKTDRTLQYWEVEPAGIRFHSPISDFVAWTEFKRWKETPGLLVLFTDVPIPLPKHALNDAQLAKLTEILASNVGQS